MDSARADTSSGRFGGQWAFLSNPPQHDQVRSLPPSSYIRSDRSSVSPLPTGLHLQHLNASRSSLPRNIYTPSAGGHSSATIPSQPVLIRVHSADASAHLHPAPRPPRRRPIMSKNNELPPIAEFSLTGILAAIEEDIEGDINAISEILGRSRLVLADQHESHLPPQGEIRATTHPLQAVEEASSSNERLAADDVLILDEDASLVGGSHAGSAAYGLLERLQAMPRTRRMRSDLPSSSVIRRAPTPLRNNSSPAVLTDISQANEPLMDPPSQDLRRTSRNLLQFGHIETRESTPQSRATNAVVSETYLSAGANGRMFSDPPVVSEAGRHYPLYSYDESEIFESSAPTVTNPRSFRERMQRLLLLRDFQSLMGSLSRESQAARARDSSAEVRLRGILNREQRSPIAEVAGVGVTEDPDLYE